MIFFRQPYFVNNTVIDGYVVSVSDAPSRIYAQYRNKPKAVKWYAITSAPSLEIADAAQQVKTMYDINAAYGEQLDIIGKIVVISRDFIQDVPLYPGLFSDPDGDEFGDSAAMFSETSISADTDMSDELYRIAIKSKIVKNNSDSSIESILKGANFLLSKADVLRLIDGEDMSFSIEFYGQITEIERYALLNIGLMPKPQGVRFNGFLEGYNYVQFGDSETQFGDLNAEFTGFTSGV